MATRFRLLIIVTLVLSLIAVDFSAAPPAGAVPPDYFGPRIDGKTIVWERTYYGVHYVNWKTIDSDIVKGVEGVTQADVAGDRLVWIKDGKLDGISLSSGASLDLPAANGVEAADRAPALDGDRLVWFTRADDASPWRLLTVDLGSAASPVQIAVLPDGAVLPDSRDRLRPAVSGDRMVWGFEVGDRRGADGTLNPAHRWELWSARIGEEPVQAVSGTESYLTGYDIGGTTIVYGVDSDIVLVDVRFPDSTQVLGALGANPTTDGRYVFWEGGNWPEGDVYGYDLLTSSYLGALPKAPKDGNSSPWTRGGVVAWLQRVPATMASPEIEARQIQDTLPSAPQPDPGTTSRHWLYFKETGHYLSYGFKDFWLRSGGLPVFGYPLTDEYDELNPELGIYRTVQYTERQRFEYHPELAGTPYETLLGRLGHADAKRRGLLTHPAFQPLPATTQSTTHSDFFPQTGHRVSHGFRAYWRGHGLDFGDPGISYRESLALFGYPISEEFVDPDTGLVTQYFERAVFEYHPDNPEPYKVLLRRLGAEEMNRRGW
jgi:hypothetical protein